MPRLKKRNYIRPVKSKKPKQVKIKDNKELALHVYEMAILTYNFVEILDYLEKYNSYRHDLKRTLKAAMRELEKKLADKSSLLELSDEFFNTNTDYFIAEVEHRRSLSRTLITMPKENLQMLNLMLSKLNGNNKSIIENFLNKLS